MKSFSALIAIAFAQLCLGCSTPSGNLPGNSPTKIDSIKVIQKDANDPRRESVIATIVPYRGNLQFDDEKTRDEAPAFTELIANAIRKEAGELSIEINIERPLVISIGPSIKAILYNTLVKCQADRAACPSLIDSYVKSNAAIARRVSDTTRKSQ